MERGRVGTRTSERCTLLEVGLEGRYLYDGKTVRHALVLFIMVDVGGCDVYVL